MFIERPDSDLRSGVDRRDLLKIGAAGLLTAAAAPREALAAKGKAPTKKTSRIPVGVQLYSVRADCAKDFDAALRQIADMGFEGVEFAGYYKYEKDPEGLRKKLDELKLKVAGTHIGAGSFAPDKLRQTVAFHKTIGCPYLIVPGDSRFTDPEKSKEYAKLMTDTAVALKGEGLACGHHNHTAEFKKDGETTYWDLFAQRTSKDVALQLDVGHAVQAGMDPIAVIKKAAGRIKSTHIKGKTKGQEAQGKKPIIGMDAIDWKSVLSTLYSDGGTDWFLVEQEEYPDGRTPMDCTQQSLEGLKKALVALGK